MGCKGTACTEKIEAVKTVEIHSFLLLTHIFLAIKTSKFQEPLRRCNIFNAN